MAAAADLAGGDRDAKKARGAAAAAAAPRLRALDVDDGRHARNDYDCNVEPPGWERKAEAALSSATAAVLRATHDGPSIYTGESGVAYMLLHLARRGLHASGEAAAADEALQRLRRSERDFSSRRVTLLEGGPGNVALQAAALARAGRREEALACVDRLRELARKAAALSEGECEVLYGRCGFLGAVLLVRQELGDRRLLRAEATELVKQVVEAGQRGATGQWPLMYAWHDKRYLGGAHGVAGILMTLAQFPEELALAHPDARRLLQETADQLLADRFSSGNVPSKVEGRDDRLVHWCHGATGAVPLALKMAETFQDPRYLAAACELGEVVWLRGLLTEKGPGLCHGAGGSGFVLLSLYRGTGDRLWLRRAQAVADFAAERHRQLVRYADEPYSLFTGLGGACCFWAEVLYASRSPEPPSDVLFPCYEFR